MYRLRPVIVRSLLADDFSDLQNARLRFEPPLPATLKGA